MEEYNQSLAKEEELLDEILEDIMPTNSQVIVEFPQEGTGSLDSEKERREEMALKNSRNEESALPINDGASMTPPIPPRPRRNKQTDLYKQGMEFPKTKRVAALYPPKKKAPTKPVRQNERQ